METMDMMQNAPADAGRGTDSVMAHMSLGEVVIPRAFMDDPQVMQLLQQIFQAGGADINEFTVGHELNKINPETGYPEFGFFKSLKKILRIAAPLALSVLAPGLGTAIGGGLLGAGAAGSATLGNALLGAGIGGLTGGGLKGAALGGITGGIGANIGNVGTAANPGSGILGAAGSNIPGVYDIASGLSSLGDGVGGIFSGGSSPSGISSLLSGDLLGSPAGTPLAGGIGPTQGSGILGSATRGVSSVGSALGSASSGGGSSFGGIGNISSLASALGGFQQDDALKKQKEQLLTGQTKQLANLDNLNPVDVQNDPGYQFNLDQGQQALDRSLGAQGGLFSGNALKAASQYNQDFANNYYNQAYQRQASKVGAQNDIYGNSSNINANATLGKSNNINQTLANALGGVVGNYNGNNVGAGLTDAQLQALLKQRGLA